MEVPYVEPTHVEDVESVQVFPRERIQTRGDLQLRSGKVSVLPIDAMQRYARIPVWVV